MYERFTDKARKVMQLANYEAQRLNHEYMGTEHLLLGLLKEGSGVAAIVLQNLQIHLRKIRRQVERIVQPLQALAVRGKLPMTPRAKIVLEYAMEESRTLKHNYVGTEHILLGLLRDEEGVAAQVLRKSGLTLETVRDAVSKLLGGGPGYSQFREEMASSTSPGDPVGRAAHPENDALIPFGKPGKTPFGFERFTDRSSNAMRLANQEAQRFAHEYIGTEHILLGLVKLGSGVAAHVLASLDVDVPKVCVEIDKLVGQGQVLATGKLPLTPRAKTAINYAMEQAVHLNHSYVGTEHLLLGLLREQEGVAAQVLTNLGLQLEEVRKEVLDLLGHGL